MVSSSGMYAAYPDKIIVAAETAFVAAIAFLVTHGTYAQATGSQISPNVFCRAIAAAWKLDAAVPPIISTIPAAAIAEPEPFSA